jgi:tetratricopeptide (TPR) repeat protein
MRARVIVHLFLLGLMGSLSLTAKESWITLDTPNFMLCGNAGEKEIRQVGVNLEQFREVFFKLFQLSAQHSTVPTRVVIFRSDKSFTPFKPLYQGKPISAAGFFQGGREINYIALTTETSAQNPYEVIYHEYVHNLLHDYNGEPPIWLGEGIAELYSTFEVAGNSREVTLGKPKPNHVYLLREKKFIPLTQLFQAGHDSREYNERDKQSVFYAESWAFIHYLALGNDGKRQQQLGKFLTGTAAGKSETEAFRDAFQCDYAAMEKELRQYIGRDSYPIKIFTLKERLGKAVPAPSRPLSEGEVAYYQGDLLLHANRGDEARTYLERSIGLDPGFAPAQASLGKYFAEKNEWELAREHLEKAVAQESKDFLTPFLFAQTMFSVENSKGFVKDRFSTETTSRILNQLKTTIQLAPDFVEAYALYGYVSLSTGQEMDQAIAYLLKAVTLAPGRPEIPFNLANLYLRKEDWVAAKKWLAPLTRSTNDTGVYIQARTLLSQIQQREEELALMEKARRESELERAKEAQEIDTRPAETSLLTRKEPKPAVELQRRDQDSSTFRPIQLNMECSSCKKLAGLLVATNCTDHGIVFVIKAGSSSWKFLVKELDNVFLYNSKYQNLGSMTMRCGPLSPSRSVVAEYHPSERETPDNPGSLINLIFADQ